MGKDPEDPGTEDTGTRRLRDTQCIPATSARIILAARLPDQKKAKTRSARPGSSKETPRHAARALALPKKRQDTQRAPWLFRITMPPVKSRKASSNKVQRQDHQRNCGSAARGTRD